MGVLGVATRRLDGAWSGSLARFVEFGVWHCQSCMGYHQYVAPYSANPQQVQRSMMTHRCNTTFIVFGQAMRLIFGQTNILNYFYNKYSVTV